jgi:hypothetical protein
VSHIGPLNPANSNDAKREGVPASPRASKPAARGRRRGCRGGGGSRSEAKKPAGQRPRGRPRKQPVKDDTYGSSDEELAAKNDEAEEEEDEESDEEEEDEEEDTEGSAEENDQEEEKVNHDEKHESEDEGIDATMNMKKLQKRKRQVTPKATELERRRPLFTAHAATTATAMRPSRTESRSLVEVEVDQVAEFLFLSEPRGGAFVPPDDGLMDDDEDHTSSGRIVSTIGDVAFLEETIDEKQRREAREQRASRPALVALDSTLDEGTPSAIAELLGDADLLGCVSEAIAEGLRRRSSNGDNHARSATAFVDTIVRESERLDRQVRALKAQQRAFGDLLCAMLGRDRRPDRGAAKAREAEARRQELRGARAEAEAEAVRQRQRADQAAIELASERLKARQHEELLAQAHREMESLRRELVERKPEADAPQPPVAMMMTLTSPSTEDATQAQAQQEVHQDHSEKQVERHDDDEGGDDDNHDQHGDDVSQQHFSPISEDLVDPAPPSSSADFIEFI